MSKVMALVELRHISKSYQEPGSGVAVPVLRDVSWVVEPGESMAIVGPSGCGKSTLLNILGTLDEPDEGEMWFEGDLMRGCSVARLSALRSRKIGFIFQLHHLMPQCTVLENVLLPTLALAKGDRDDGAPQRAEELLARVGLQERRDWLPSQLSGGERQRVAVVRALINQPRLILADEPTGALDEKNASALTELLLDLQGSLGVSLVMVTHHPAQAERMSQVWRMHEGGLIRQA
jgi:lipoprotein-releasing system ATP-binding protein